MASVAATIDPRIERSRAVICAAAIDELAEVGYGAMSIESIAKRAGVGKATVYRHWPGKLELVESALDRAKDDLVVPVAGTAREQVTAILTWLAGLMADSAMSDCMPALVSAAQYDAHLGAFLHRYSGVRQQVLIDVLESGIASGEIDTPPDTKVLAQTLVGPIFHARLMSADPFPVDQVSLVVDLVLGSRLDDEPSPPVPPERDQ